MSKSAMEILKSSPLSKPRMMGTQGEKETVKYITNFLAVNSLRPQKEEVQWSNGLVRGRKLMNGFIILFLAFFTFSVFYFRAPLNGYIPIAAVLGFSGFITLFLALLKNGKFEFLGKKAKGENVLCRISSYSNKSSVLESKEEEENELELENKKPMKEIFLTAHYDSIASSMPIVSKISFAGTGISILFIILFSVATGILNLISYYGSISSLVQISIIFRWIIFGFSGLGIVLISISFFNKRTNDSSGVCDNGSGCAVLLELASHFGKNPLENANLTFIWCAAEEWGLYGSKEFVKGHKEDLLKMKDRFYNINVDMVGQEIAYLEKKGVFRKKPLNKTLNLLIKKSAEEKGIEIRGFKTMMVGSSDHAPFKKLKLEVATFLSKKDFKKIHSENDNIDVVKAKNIEGIVVLLKTVIQKLGQ